MSESLKRGKTGEALVAAWLQRRGYTVVTQNYHSRYGEIDLIACNDRYLAFVEVKARRGRQLTVPREAVTPAKQQKILQTAMTWLERYPTELQPRFDVAEVYLDRDRDTGRVEYFENAFA